MDEADTVRAALEVVDGAVEGEDAPADPTDRLLAIGVDRLDVDDAYLTRIDRSNGYWTAITAVNGAVETGQALDLDETYCRETVESGRLALADAEAAGWAGDPALERHGHAAYLGHRVDLGDGGVGTVCFVAPEPRDEPFSPTALLLAEAISRRIELARYRGRTDDRIDHLEGFVSLISHDLRNPLTVARGWIEAEQATAESDGLDRALTALGRIEGLIEDGVSFAREAQPVGDTEPVSLGDVAASSWRGIGAGEATLEVEGDLRFVADNTRLRHVFEPLFRNAVDHGGEDVTVRVGPLEADRGFYVTDDGPGIEAEIRDRVFEPGFSTDGGGPGFGLAMARASVEAHGWSLVLAGGDEGARFEIRDVVIPPAE